MSYILALDTTTDPGSIALARGPELLEEAVLKAPEGYGDILFLEIQKLLERHSIRLQDIECFASASGPGTFTGVRAGLTAVKGFGDTLGRKVVGVSNLQAVAWFGSGELRAPHLDARRGEVYGGVYDSQLRVVQGEVVMKFDEWVAGLPAGAVPMGQEKPLARAIAAIAWERMQSGLGQDAAEVDANYVRRADAELMWREQ
ncbi:MAG: tRNA (adenosine(37)-N6)-threonylcarbamoyltransferase complex dimerization subunit type 1 TsaB [Bryobacteraceae bacterium]